MNGVYLLLGTNLGERLTNLHSAIRMLAQMDVHMKDSSSIYETEPWGLEDQPWFLNAIVRVETKKTAKKLLQACLDVELQMGRIRNQKWGARLIDIDLLFFNNEIIQTRELQLPHPGIPDRRFTLLPFCEKWGDQVHPENGSTLKEMLDALPKTVICRKTDLVLAP